MEVLLSYYFTDWFLIHPSCAGLGRPASLSKTIMGDEISENLLYCCVMFSNISKLWRGWLHKEQIWLLYPFGYWQIVKRRVWIVRGVPSNKTGWVQSKALEKVSKWFGNHWKTRGTEHEQWWIIRLWWCEILTSFLIPGPESSARRWSFWLSWYANSGTTLQSKSDRMSVWKVMARKWKVSF